MIKSINNHALNYKLPIPRVLPQARIITDPGFWMNISPFEIL